MTEENSELATRAFFENDKRKLILQDVIIFCICFSSCDISLIPDISLNLIIKEYLEDDDVTFSSSAYALNELKLEIERETSEDVEIVDKYEQEEHDDEVRCMNEHEF